MFSLSRNFWRTRLQVNSKSIRIQMTLNTSCMDYYLSHSARTVLLIQTTDVALSHRHIPLKFTITPHLINSHTCRNLAVFLNLGMHVKPQRYLQPKLARKCQPCTRV